MATDYDAPRKSEEDLNEDSIEALKTRRVDKPTAVVDEDEAELAEGYELPGADLSGKNSWSASCRPRLMNSPARHASWSVTARRSPGKRTVCSSARSARA